MVYYIHETLCRMGAEGGVIFILSDWKFHVAPPGDDCARAISNQLECITKQVPSSYSVIPA